MSANVVNQVPYLRTSRSFPEEADRLVLEIDKAYVDIANAVNNRTVSIFPTVNPCVTGESYFITNNRRQQSFRRVYTFTGTSAINHGITFSNITYMTRMYGQFTDATNWYGLIAGSNVAIAGQLSFYLTPTQITFLAGAGSPTLTSGIIVLEWLSNT